MTLEDKLGQEYEPYIFAALQSAKIMLVVGTDYEYYNAVWVKNEWSRFLQLMTSGQKKYLIPCFKGIDAYDMPKEFAKLQAQDLGKVGAMQDLLRGVAKLVGVQNEGPKTAPIAISASPENALIDRGYLYMDDKEFNKANEYFERALDVAPQAWRAYLGKVLSRHSCATVAELEAYVEKHSCDIDNDKNFIRAIEFSPQKEKQQLLSIVELVKEKRLEKVYLKASDLLSQKKYRRAADLFANT